jgi:glutamine cyclotransferase
MRHRAFVACTCAPLLLGCSGNLGSDDYTVVRRFPHDTAAYTQGLVYAGGRLYESTGLLGQSQVRLVDLETGQVQVSHALPADRFGEGLALLDERLYQLTWTSGVGYIYDAQTLAPLDSFQYAGQGWGLATDGESLIMTDGSATLRFLDPATFAVRREVTIQDRGSPLLEVNELEYVDGLLYGNVYRSDWIVRIDPATGAVLDWIDLAGLLPERDRTPSTDVLNGIAFDAGTGHLLVTGKRWPALFEIRLRSPGDRPGGS